MTRTERVLARRWRSALLACVLVALAGAVLIIWARIDAEARRADQLAAEADRRGNAVGTLAGDVRALREQVKAAGKTPVAPDPSKAIANLPDRVEVPVPIPGPKGDKGDPGKTGTAGSDGTDGNDGANGQNGTTGVQGPQGLQGPQGEQGPKGDTGDTGAQGPKGDTGDRGPAGPACPDGYSLQAPSYDPDALVCRRDGAPDPEPSKGSGLLSMAALAPDRRRA